MIEKKITCPLGSQCESVVSGVVERCAWYVEMAGTNPQTGEIMPNQSRCAMNWIPLILVEGNGRNVGVQAAVESLRNTVLDTTPIKLIAGLLELPDGNTKAIN